MRDISTPPRDASIARQRRELTPTDLVAEARQTQEFAFSRLHRGAGFMAVRLLADAPELEGGLKNVAGSTLPVKPIMATMAFKTQALRGAEGHAWTFGKPAFSRPSLRPRSLGDGRYHLVRLAKREGAASAFSDRISLGRAASEDVVLRHMSVSKFHAWFEIDEALRWHVTDAGSMNHTFVNDAQLEPNVRTLVPPWSQIQLGQVGAVLLDASGIWQAVREQDELP